jgi:hypothetical protein
MIVHDRLLPVQASRDPTSIFPLAGSFASVGAGIAQWLATAADYWVAATMYEQLSGLSDAEVHRRGLSRATLAWEITQACDRNNG